MEIYFVKSFGISHRSTIIILILVLQLLYIFFSYAGKQDGTVVCVSFTLLLLDQQSQPHLYLLIDLYL